MIVRLSVHALVDLVRAAFEAGAAWFDPYTDDQPKDPTDGDFMKVIVDCFGGVDSFMKTEDHGPRITAAAIPEEIDEVLAALKAGARLSIGDDMKGFDLSEAFSTLVYQLITDAQETAGDFDDMAPAP